MFVQKLEQTSLGKVPFEFEFEFEFEYTH